MKAPWWLKNRTFFRMLVGQSVSMMGSHFTKIALIILVTTITRDPMALAIVSAVQMLPLLLSPLAGALVDRWDKKRVMVVVDLARALCAGLVALSGSLWQIYLLSFLLASLSIFFGPARSSVLPELVEAENMTSAVALGKLSSNVMVFAGPALAGLIIAGFGTRSAFLVDAATFLIAAINIQTLNLSRVVNKLNDGVKGMSSLWLEVREGIVGMLAMPALAMMIAFLTAILLSAGLVNVSGVHYLTNVLGSSEKEVGYVMSLSGAGAIIATVYLTAKGKKHSEYGVAFTCAAIMGLTFLSYLAEPSYLGVCLRMLTTGLVGTALFIPVTSLLYKLTPSKIRGRVFSLVDMLFSGMPVLGYLGAGLILRLWPAHLVIGISGAYMFLVTGLFYWRYVASQTQKGSHLQSGVQEPRVG